MTAIEIHVSNNRFSRTYRSVRQGYPRTGRFKSAIAIDVPTIGATAWLVDRDRFADRGSRPQPVYSRFHAAARTIGTVAIEVTCRSGTAGGTPIHVIGGPSMDLGRVRVARPALLLVEFTTANTLTPWLVFGWDQPHYWHTDLVETSTIKMIMFTTTANSMSRCHLLRQDLRTSPFSSQYRCDDRRKNRMATARSLRGDE